MVEDLPILVQVSRGDKALLDKLNWFLTQPGVTWLEDKISSPAKDIPRLNINRKGVILEAGGETLRFHPSMSLLRLINIRRGERDRFLEAAGLEPGDHFIDATLGLGTDALIAAWSVGEKGNVIAIEQAGIIAALVKDGLRDLSRSSEPRGGNFEKEQAWKSLAQAAARIEVKWGKHQDVLQDMAANSADVVYFDPMFRQTRVQSASIRPLHGWAEAGDLSPAAVEEACRVARRRVVMKERKNSLEFARLRFAISPGGRYSEVDYGVIKL